MNWKGLGAADRLRLGAGSHLRQAASGEHQKHSRKEVMASLSFVKGADSGTTVELKEEKTVLGRSEGCTIVLNVPAVSREHAVIRRIAGKFYIEDLNSRNRHLRQQQGSDRAHASQA